MPKDIFRDAVVRLVIVLECLGFLDDEDYNNIAGHTIEECWKRIYEDQYDMRYFKYSKWSQSIKRTNT